MLVLPIKKKWFDMIRSGEKKEEYREIKPYWNKRFTNEAMKQLGPLLIGYTNKFLNLPFAIKVTLRAGYNKNSPKMICKCVIHIGEGKQEWGAEFNKEYYVLEILEILEVRK